MALADYWLCDVCDRKTFYDATLDYDFKHPTRARDSAMLPHGAGDMACICPECSKTHEVVVQKKEARPDAG